MAVTVIVVATGNLSIGVVVGTINGMIVFARRVAHLTEVTAVTDPDGSTVTRTAPGRGDRGRGSAGGRAPTDR
jgi:SulP family sulfate permease